MDQARAPLAHGGARASDGGASAAPAPSTCTSPTSAPDSRGAASRSRAAAPPPCFRHGHVPGGVLARQRPPSIRPSRNRWHRSRTSSRRDRRRCESSPATTRGCAGSARSDPHSKRRLTIDLTAPTVEVPRSSTTLKLGGLDFMLYKASPDATMSGVAVGNYFFPGHGRPLRRPGDHGAFFADPQDLDAKVAPKAVAGRCRRQPTRGELPHGGEAAPVRRPRRSRSTTPFRAQGPGDSDRERSRRTARSRPGLPLRESHASGSRARSASADVTRTVGADAATGTAHSSAQPNSAAACRLRRPPLVSPRRRDHRYRGAPRLRPGVAPSSAGRGREHGHRSCSPSYLGIYGDAVIIDHGLGIFSLYGHLSAITVKAGREVQRGDTVGRDRRDRASRPATTCTSASCSTASTSTRSSGGTANGSAITSTAEARAIPRATVTARRDG